MAMVLIIVSSIFNGYALSVLWGWFIVPTFNAPKLTVVPAIGIALVVSYMTHQVDTSKDDDKRNLREKFVSLTVEVIGKPLFALFFGSVVQMFM